MKAGIALLDTCMDGNFINGRKPFLTGAGRQQNNGADPVAHGVIVTAVGVPEGALGIAGKF